MDAQADLSSLGAHAEGMFSHVAANSNACGLLQSKEMGTFTSIPTARHCY